MSGLGVVPIVPVDGGTRDAGQASVDAFRKALDNNGAGQPPKADSDPAAVSPTEAASEQERARRALSLDAPSPSTTGDSILGGLQKMRGIFDVQQERISALANEKVVDANTLLGMQVEVVKYTMLLDMSSKLTGKTTQAVDQLMKGQ
ncbi:MAG: EscI/YscI/HrpB family type III secretion system inner rod protein [Pseudochelatococcus sp.]|uniref:EscI/YscI/HrpB family type III secretion system inner rod protein n=1 Tax=Pseudochelatococcus sp. TaxID=2020869 RepID=UPI003D8E0BFB